MNDKILEAATRLLGVLITNFGPWGTIALVAIVLLALFGWKYYNNRRADRAIDLVLAEKEKTIQRLANQERTWRKLFLTKGIQLSSKEADELLRLEGEYENPAQSRRAIAAGQKKRK